MIEGGSVCREIEGVCVERSIGCVFLENEREGVYTESGSVCREIERMCTV